MEGAHEGIPSGFCIAVTNMEGFNSHLNMEQMNKALISLIDMYEKAAVQGDYCSNGAYNFRKSFGYGCFQEFRISPSAYSSHYILTYCRA